MTTILFAKESDCEENPGGHDLRATLVPQDVRRYVDRGFDVVVQQGLGEGIGYLDRQYELEGARVESYPSCYGGKDLVVKLKGPSAAEVAQLSYGTTLFSMGHLYCFPERERLLRDKGVRLVGMETVTDPQEPSDGYLAGIAAGSAVDAGALGPEPEVMLDPSAPQEYVNGLLRALMRYGRKPVRVRCTDTAGAEQSRAAVSGSAVLTVGDGVTDLVPAVGGPYRLGEGDLPAGRDGLLAEERGKPVRAIGQIREVGIGGTKYGLDLYRSRNSGRDPEVLVLGYGNCSMGAFEHLRDRRVEFTVLGRPQTTPDELPGRLASAQLIVNGAETPGETEYIITRRNAERDIPVGAVVIDLIGGSPALRSPVESFVWTTFLPDIHFEEQGRFFAGLWGWDMYYSMHDTALEYSRRIAKVLTSGDRYAKSLDDFVSDYAYALQLGG
ncbi:hypothetical protein ACTMTU_12830 [Streptomyces sp. OZ13]|uniref:hypothetical protein n=1 Tax=Streptomyces sp. OZ13 TaxID=3452210 RepID=UPI003F8AC6C5